MEFLYPVQVLQKNAFVTKTVPYVSFNFRNASDLRSKRLKVLILDMSDI